MEWWKKSVFYQIYPLGFCGAERVNDFGDKGNRLNLIEAEIPRLTDMGVTAVLLNPVFQSESHGYDTVDFTRVDGRLGCDADLKRLCGKLHASGIKVVLDGVFNHMGRSFDKFADVRQCRENSRWRHWFNIDFGGDSQYGDGFWYEGWEGHYSLVKLNLGNDEVRCYLIERAKEWIDKYDIDGLRLDVGYMLPENFLRELSAALKGRKNDFFLVAEAIHGDYNRLLNCGIDSVTNYECYKGLHSAVNSRNLFEIEHSLSRQFANTQWALYKGRHLMNFADNHDVPRVYTLIKDKRDVPALYAVLFAMPGIPCLYYGSEYGAEGDKGDCDAHLRPAMADIDRSAHPELYEIITKLSRLRGQRVSLTCGSYDKVTLSNEYFCARRDCEGETTLLCVNISDAPVVIKTPFAACEDLLDGTAYAGGEIELPPHAFKFLDAK